MQNQIQKYFNKELSSKEQTQLLQIIVAMSKEQLSQYFDQILNILLQIVDSNHIKYNLALEHLLKSESLKYSLLFVCQKLNSEAKNGFNLICYLPQYLLMSNIQIHRQNIINSYCLTVNQIMDQYEELSDIKLEMVECFVRSSLTNLILAKGKTNITIKTVIEIFDLISNCFIRRNQQQQSSLIKYQNQCQELIRIFEISIQQGLTSKTQYLVKSIIACQSYKNTLKQQKFQDLCLIFMRYRNPNLITKILNFVRDIKLQSLKFQQIELPILIHKIMQLVGTNPALQSSSKQIIGLISRLPLSTQLYKQLWMQVFQLAEPYNFKSFCLSQYKIHCKLYSQQTIVDIAKFVKIIESINKFNVQYVRQLLNFVFVVNSFHNVEQIIKKIQSLQRIQLKQFQQELIQYSITMILEYKK